MKIRGYRHTRCVKRQLSKCADGVVKTYSVLESRFADMLQADETVKEFRCNVYLTDCSAGDYCSDFVAVKMDGDLMVRECVYQKNLTKPKTLRLLDASREYWLRRGVEDWGLVVDKQKEYGDGKESAH